MERVPIRQQTVCFRGAPIPVRNAGQMRRRASPALAPRFLGDRRWDRYTVLADVSSDVGGNAPHDFKELLNNALLPLERERERFFGDDSIGGFLSHLIERNHQGGVTHEYD